MPSLDDAAEVVAIVRQDHTFEFRDLLKDREELRSGHKKEVLGQQDPVGLGGPADRSWLRYQCKANGSKPEMLAWRLPKCTRVIKCNRTLFQASHRAELASRSHPIAET